jgi:polar amino acid transport system permease protein
LDIVQTLIGELPQFGKGVLVALQLLIGLMSVGMVLGLALAITEVFGNRPLRFVAGWIRKLLWAVPQLVLLSIVFYLPFNFSPMLAAIGALGVCSAAFQSQIFRGAILSIQPGQLEAAKAMGLGQFRTIIHVIIPQMVRLSIGGWTNELASELKDTSLAYVVGVMEIMRQGKSIISYTFGNSLVVYFFIACIYFCLTRAGTHIFYRIEDKLWVPGFEKRKD